MALGPARGDAVELRTIAAEASSLAAAGKPCSVCGSGRGAPSHSIGGCVDVQCDSGSSSSSTSDRARSSQLDTTDISLVEACSSDSTPEKQPRPPPQQQHLGEHERMKKSQVQSCKFDLVCHFAGLDGVRPRPPVQRLSSRANDETTKVLTNVELAGILSSTEMTPVRDNSTGGQNKGSDTQRV